MYADTDEWLNSFAANGLSFSFGSRIHGSVMPILAGVPATVYTCDSRTREMAEFFDIPHILPADAENKKFSLYELYLQSDYSDFNKNFSKRFDEFESFLRKCGITDKINGNNIFMSLHPGDFTEPFAFNREYLQKKELAVV